MPAWMTGNAIAQWALLSVLLLLSARPLGSYMYRIFTGQRTFLHPVLRPIEVAIYRITRVDEGEEMTWYIYLLAVLAFSIVGQMLFYVSHKPVLELLAGLEAVKHFDGATVAEHVTGLDNLEGGMFGLCLAKGDYTDARKRAEAAVGANEKDYRAHLWLALVRWRGRCGNILRRASWQ